MLAYRTALAALFAIALAGHAQAQSAEEFYKGRQITFVVGYEVGNDYDIGARLLARHLSRELPGSPTVVVQKMPQQSGFVSSTSMAVRAAPHAHGIGRHCPHPPAARMAKPTKSSVSHVGADAVLHERRKKKANTGNPNQNR